MFVEVIFENHEIFIFGFAMGAKKKGNHDHTPPSDYTTTINPRGKWKNTEKLDMM